MAELLQQEQKDLNKINDFFIENVSDDELLTQILREGEVTLTLGQRVADKVASFGGSWTFIILFFSILVGWIILNAYILSQKPFDPYPFILLNLVLSCLAAIQAPIIMMSQNRQEEKDRERAEHDYLINLKAELEIRNLQLNLKNLFEVQKKQMEMLNEIQQKLHQLNK
jgi:uncharacterized membrane protein